MKKLVVVIFGFFIIDFFFNYVKCVKFLSWVCGRSLIKEKWRFGICI